MALFSRKKKEEKKPKAGASANISVAKNDKKPQTDKKEETKATAQKTGFIRKSISIQQPIVSEKTLALSSDQNQYTFLVDRDATKPEIKKQIQKRYNVNITRVRTIRLQGKANMFRGKRSTSTPVKKAIVTVQKGQKIDIAGNV